MDIEPLYFESDERRIADLRERIGRTRFPEPGPGDPWSHGTELGALRALLDDWARFSWPPPELANRIPEIVAWTTWSEVRDVVVRSRERLEVADELAGTVTRLCDATITAIDWHT